MPDSYGFIQNQKRGDSGFFDGVQWRTSTSLGANDTYPTARLNNWFDGSTSQPTVLELPTYKIIRTELITSPAHNLDPGYNSALSVQVNSLTNNKSQSQAIWAQASGFADTANYVLGGYFAGVHTAGAGGASAIFVVAETTVSGGVAQGITSLTYNASGAAQAYAAGGNGITGYDCYYNSSGNFYAGAGIQIRALGSNSKQWDVGIGFCTSAVRSASIRDDSSSTTVFDIRGSHTDGLDFTNATISGSMVKFPAWNTTWTPTYSSDGGTLTTVTTNAAAWMQLGKLLFFHLDVTVTNAGTATGRLRFTLPNSLLAKTGAGCIVGKDVAVTAKGINGEMVASSGTVFLTFSDASANTADTSGRRYYIGGSIEVA